MSEWKRRTVVILGLARQGKALAKYLLGQGADVIVSDLKDEESLREELKEMEDLPLSFVLGHHPFTLLDGSDALFLSGGVPADIPLVTEARRRGIRISNDSQLFLELSPAPVIGITGSAGKSTTTELVGRIGNQAMADKDARVWVGGNIGRPLLEDVSQIGEGDWTVVELSSFQLEIMTLSPHIAAVLNLTPNHLDRHKTMEAYAEAKTRILIFQGREDVAVLNRDDPGAWALRSEVKGELLTFGMDGENVEHGTFVSDGRLWLRDSRGDSPICSMDSILLRGRHNVENVTAACAIAAAAGFSIESMAEGIRTFAGIEHRLEFIRTVRGADWYNDSIATSPERAIAAMKSFDVPIVLLAGGRDKDLPWEEFAMLVAEKVKHLILFGEARTKIEGTIEDVEAKGRLSSLHSVEGLGEAVEIAAELVEEGEVVLLAPGGTSFDQYVDFAERGDDFRKLVEGLV